MNLRTVVAALYLTVFAVTLLNMMALPNSVIAENVVTIFSALILALTGVLIATWVYQDGENIKMLHGEIEKLEAKVTKLEKT